jgi:uncharacterized membrane protein YbhN (UPF0104 family)
MGRPEAAKGARAKRALKAIVSLSLLGGLLALIARREGVDALGAQLASLSPAWILAAVGAQVVCVTLSLVRWRALLSVQGLHLPTRQLARAFLIGRFYGVFTPSTAGLDVYRAIFVGRATGEHIRSAATIVVEKLFGLLSLVLLTFALLPFGGDRWLGGGAIGVAVLVGLGAALGVAALHDPRPLAPLVARLPARIRGKLEDALATITARPLCATTAAYALALGVGAHLSMSAVYAAAGAALGVQVGVAELLLVGNAIILATLLPISVAGVGVREGVAVALLGAAGVPASDALLVAVLGFLATQPPALLGGLLQLAPAEAEAPPLAPPG